MRSIQRLTLTSLTVLLILSQQPNSGFNAPWTGDSASNPIVTHSAMKPHPMKTSLLTPLTQRVKQLKTLVLLVSFEDQAIQTKPAEWQQLIFSKDGESVRHYYQNMSQGQFDLAPMKEQQGTANDGVVEVSVPMKHPNNGSELTRGNYQAVWLALNNALSSLDLTDVDANSDKVITSNELLVIAAFAGYEDLYKKAGEKSSSGFSHYLYENNMVGSYKFTDFLQVGELYYDAYQTPKTSITSYGIIAHELGHILGLPDLYDTDYTSYGVGFFSLMGNGDKLYYGAGKLGNNPAGLDPWSRIYLGFARETMISESGTYDVNASTTKVPTIYRINTANPKEYYLIENRLNEGQDIGLSGFSTKGGILIWHIDEAAIEKLFESNTVNDDETHKGVDVVEASEAIYGYSQLDTMNASHKYAPYFTATNKLTVSGQAKSNLQLFLYTGQPVSFSMKALQDGEKAKIQVEIQK